MQLPAAAAASVLTELSAGLSVGDRASAQLSIYVPHQVPPDSLG